MFYNKTMEKENAFFLKRSAEDIAEEEYIEEIADEPTGTAVVAQDEPEGVMIAWEAPEAEHIEKSTTWYWSSMAIAIVLIAIALWQKNFLFAVFIVVAELAIFMFAGEKPKMWRFAIDDKGITIEKHKTYRYKDVVLYDIHEFSDEYYELLLKTRSKMTHYIKIFVPAEDVDAIEDLLEGRVERGEIEVTF